MRVDLQAPDAIAASDPSKHHASPNLRRFEPPYHLAGIEDFTNAVTWTESLLVHDEASEGVTSSHLLALDPEEGGLTGFEP